ncbi:DUF4249 domain-containing protein [Mucilaginibacter sp. BJC16-A38]|uniref:DUF4249 domain-containing protein n=1 Tax=Mucilaginibacter phenanthrenivorans TaxID=1234842 RepID=UPI0021579914|nr:DUF4249 domain-containing protein [Mucilaginibacter phenanthrenivorans]MCR8558849.1 DUF4249 domain-containing protein [Mucilaginibacter phenanthrenivorans]
MKLYKIYIVSVLSILTVSCTKVVDLKLGNDTGKLVIEGNLTDVNGPQYIKISRNVPFTNTNTYPAVTGASVSVVDDAGHTYPYNEGPSGTYTSSSMNGVAGSTYTMAAIINGQKYTASSTMPALVSLDSITAKNKPVNNSNHEKEITVHYQDPGGVVNQYRFVMYVNSVEVTSVFAFNDEFTDGRYIHTLLDQDAIKIYSGDTVTVEMQCIDKLVYTYWSTLMQQGSNGPSGSVAPSNPPTNISPATLGYLSAHTSQVKTIIVR